MSDQASDLLKDYQAMAQQSWDAWTHYLQQHASMAQPFGQTAWGAPFGAGEDVLTRSMAAMKGYGEWLQGAVGSGLGQGTGDWQQSLQQLFASLGGQPFAHAFASIDSEAARSFTQMWQAWLQAGQSGLAGAHFDVEHMAAFGFTRERQLQQQALAAAMQAYLESAGKYQALIQRANTEGFERLQAKLTELTNSQRQVDSLKALYDLWVDGAEEAYAQIALSEEFRRAYGDMVNAQSRVRELKQQMLDAACRELGMPTRGEVSALGKRLQELRREVRAGTSPAASEEITALRAEVAALKRELAGKAAPGKPATKKPAPRSSKRAETEKEAVVRRAKPAAAVVARKSVVRGATRTRK
ncbi:pha synthase subunit protein [Dyella solisilvae]|uniref:Poly(3-hydroxyalkanoate) polymerase subunit PhaE n=1 Tax=Dyella solisilvae TaxID=1920168 RepID=A0A370KAD3_9GAMM|nr:poly(R)-hydroxyalkanoic acid synthase subunit PhaE [Dyella solisilvae]RDI99599.1 pha synthase subunit protein [Dyella solisilvae]